MRQLRGYRRFPSLGLLLFTTLVLVVFKTQGQEAAISTRDWIAVYWDSPSSPSVTPSPQEIDFENTIIETLSAIGIKHYYAVEPDYDLGIGVYWGDGLHISIDPRTLHDHLPQADILLAHPLSLMEHGFSDEILFQVEANNEDALKAAGNFVVAMSLYSIDRCDLADPFFVAAQTHADLLLSWLASTQRDETALIAFYRGNCALALNHDGDAAHDFEQALNGENGEVYLDPAVNLAWTYLQLNRSDDAFALMDKLVAAQDNDDLRALALENRSRLSALVPPSAEATADSDIPLMPDNP